MEVEQKGFRKEQVIHALKRYWKIALLIVFLLSFLFFREFTVQLALLILAIAAGIFLVYKVVISSFVIATSFVKGTISLIAFIIAFGFIVALISRI